MRNEDKIFTAFDHALMRFNKYPEDPTLNNYMDAKGYLINKGYCADFAEYLIKLLLEAGIEEDRINVYFWRTPKLMFHVFVTVDSEVILDASRPGTGIEYTRNNVNTLFLEFAARHALDVGDYCYLISANGHAIVYDPWGFVDNQDFDHKAMPTLPVTESVLGVKEFLRKRSEKIEVIRTSL